MFREVGSLFCKGWAFSSDSLEKDFLNSEQRLDAYGFMIWCLFQLGFLVAIVLAVGSFHGWSSYVLLLSTSLIPATLFIGCPILAFRAQRPPLPLLTYMCSLGMMGWVGWALQEYVCLTPTLALHFGIHHKDGDELARLLVGVTATCFFCSICAITLDVFRYMEYHRNVFLVSLAPLVIFFLCNFWIPGFGGRCTIFALLSGPYTLYFNWIGFHNARLRRQMFQKALQQKQCNETEANDKAAHDLNHILKNLIIEALGQIELFLGDEPMAGRPPLLATAIDCLQRGAQWCQQQGPIVELSAGRYQLAVEWVRLHAFCAKAVAGFPVKVEVEDAMVCIDPMLCQVVLRRAVSIIFKSSRLPDPEVTLTVNFNNVHNRARCNMVFTLSYDAAEILELEPHTWLQRPAPRTNASCSGDMEADKDGFLAVSAADVHQMQLCIKPLVDSMTFQMELETEVIDATADDDRSGTPNSMDEAVATFPLGLCIYCIDDSKTVQTVLVHHLLRYTESAKVRAFGDNAAQVSQFIDLVMEDGDIAIMDQNLDFPTGVCLGTNIASDLRSRGFTGFICIHSANASSRDREMYRKSGAHCILPKELDGRVKMQQLKLAYLDWLRQANTSFRSTPVQVQPPQHHRLH